MERERERERGRHPSKSACLLCRVPEVVVNDLVRPFFLRAGLHGLDNPVLIDAHNVLATLTHAAFVAVVTAYGGGLRGAVGTLEGEQYDTRGNPELQQQQLLLQQLWRAEHPELLVDCSDDACRGSSR